MNNHEIQQFLESRNWSISPDDYLKIRNESPQVDHILYDSYSGKTTLWTKDGFSFIVDIDRKW